MCLERGGCSLSIFFTAKWHRQKMLSQLCFNTYSPRRCPRIAGTNYLILLGSFWMLAAKDICVANYKHSPSPRPAKYSALGPRCSARPSA